MASCNSGALAVRLLINQSCPQKDAPDLQPHLLISHTHNLIMGNQPSLPKPGTKFQVIGAGLPRTGTASFSEALRILLEGPVYHGGTQVTLGPSKEIRSWITLLSHWPPSNRSDEKLGKLYTV